jgi:hypothetical protein
MVKIFLYFFFAPARQAKGGSAYWRSSDVVFATFLNPDLESERFLTGSERNNYKNSIAFWSFINYTEQ